MFAILLSAISFLLNFVVRSLIVKFVVMFAIFFIVTSLVEALEWFNLIPSVSTLNNAFGGVSSYVWYFADLGAFSYGIPLVLSAYFTRFVIRRIPLIG